MDDGKMLWGRQHKLHLVSLCAIVVASAFCQNCPSFVVVRKGRMSLQQFDSFALTNFTLIHNVQKDLVAGRRTSAMDTLGHPDDILTMACVILFMLLNVNRSLILSSAYDYQEKSSDESDTNPMQWDSTTTAMDAATQTCLHQFCFLNSFSAVDEDLGFWVKPRSTTWFSGFILEEYDDARWMQMFRFSKRAVFTLSHILGTHTQEKRYKVPSGNSCYSENCVHLI